MANRTHEPFFRVSKNDSMPSWQALLIRVIAIVVALVIVGILSIVLIGKNPVKILEVLFTGAFVDVWTLLQNVGIMIIFGLAVIPAFRMKYWNMGANGQVLVGCLAAIAVMRAMTDKGQPAALIIGLMLLASLVASVIWSIIPAIFKAFFNTNETLFTLMMNYIAIALVNYMVFVWDKSGKGTIGIVNLISREGWVPNIGNNKYILTIVISVVLALILYVYIKFTKHGFEVDLVGESVNTARYVGINVKGVIVRTLVLSGLVCGIMGFLYAGQISHTVNSGVGGIGFTAILVAWLAGFNPLAMIATSFFVVYLNAGAEQMCAQFNLGSNDYANIVVGIIFFFVIGSEFFIRYKVQLNSYWKNRIAEKKTNKKEDK